MSKTEKPKQKPVTSTPPNPQQLPFDNEEKTEK